MATATSQLAASPLRGWSRLLGSGGQRGRLLGSEGWSGNGIASNCLRCRWPLGHQHVAAPRDITDQAMPGVTEHAPDVCDRLDERALAHHDIRPNTAHQLIFADDLAGARTQHEQHVQCLLAQPR